MSNPSTHYFAAAEEQAVVSFINSNDAEERNNLYNTKLKTPFNIMIQCIIRKYPIHVGNYTMEELELDVLTHLIDKISKFNPNVITKKGKKTKAFSYCQTIIRNYLRDHSIKTYNERKNHLNYDDYIDLCDEKMYELNGEIMNSDECKDNVDLLVAHTIDKIENKLNNKSSMLSKNDIIVGKSIINILRNWKTLFGADDECDCDKSNFQKNKILFYLQSSTNLTMKEIRSSIKKTFRQLYLIERGI